MEANVILFAAAIIVIFLLLCAAFVVGWRISRWRSCPSPYSGFPLRPVLGLSYYNMEKTLRYLHALHQYDNRLFDLSRASFCRETGRIFQDSITWYDTIHVDWSFLQKRYPGKYVSWGSLTLEQQAEVRTMHDSLEGFQTERSSKNSSPRAIERELALEKPGPLYVDINSKVLLGWKLVPGTDLEVLIVQKPIPPAKNKFTPFLDI